MLALCSAEPAPTAPQPLPEVLPSPGDSPPRSDGVELPSSFLSIDSFLDSVSACAAAGTPLAVRDAAPMVLGLTLDEALEGLEDAGTGDSSRGSESSTPALFLYEPEPEPEPGALSDTGTRPLPPPPTAQSKAQQTRYARPPSEFSSSGTGSSDADGSTGKPDSGGAVFDVVHEVGSCEACRPDLT